MAPGHGPGERTGRATVVREKNTSETFHESKFAAPDPAVAMSAVLPFSQSAAVAHHVDKRPVATFFVPTQGSTAREAGMPVALPPLMTCSTKAQRSSQVHALADVMVVGPQWKPRQRLLCHEDTISSRRGDTPRSSMRGGDSGRKLLHTSSYVNRRSTALSKEAREMSPLKRLLPEGVTKAGRLKPAIDASRHAVVASAPDLRMLPVLLAPRERATGRMGLVRDMRGGRLSVLARTAADEGKVDKGGAGQGSGDEEDDEELVAVERGMMATTWPVRDSSERFSPPVIPISVRSDPAPLPAIVADAGHGSGADGGGPARSLLQDRAINVKYDPTLDCYFDPRTTKYYELL